MAMLLVGSGCVVILVSIDPAWILSTLFGDEAGTYGADLSVFTIALLPLAVYSVVSCRIIVAGEYLILAMSYTSGILVLLVLYGAKVSFLDSISLSWAWVISQISVLVVMGVAFEFKQRGRTS
ncbi:hypothetical protein D092_21155 [Rhodococcus ruber Chol-4]|uniref:hypothetical protein n=1 Tax=Rhodococcus ruber TaxID=1830 RepID=UPI000379FA64|nr:hypothetical protein [Rhodococcus ruber]KXF84424.1 hypothetical protein D092_21155 [Rhodococcus ruber Chol-4]